jgi:hypothetical protein
MAAAKEVAETHVVTAGVLEQDSFGVGLVVD